MLKYTNYFIFIKSCLSLSSNIKSLPFLQVSATKKTETDESMSALMRSGTIRNNLFILIFVVSISGIIIDAIIRLSENIGPNLFVTYALSSVIEIPSLSLVALILDRCVCICLHSWKNIDRAASN